MITDEYTKSTKVNIRYLVIIFKTVEDIHQIIGVSSSGACGIPD